MSVTAVAFRLLAAAFVSVTISACIETAGPRYSVPGASPAPVKASTMAEKASNASEQVRLRLENECMGEYGGLLKTDEKISKQCGCYAGTIVKTMRKDDLEFFITYGVVPTLTAARPEDAKKSCGLTVFSVGGARAKLAPAETY